MYGTESACRRRLAWACLPAIARLLTLVIAPAAYAEDPKPAAPAAPAAQAPAGDLPKAEVIMEKYVEATGGRAAYGKLKNMVVEQSMDVAMANMKAKMTVYSAPPNKMLIVVDTPMGKQTGGTDGQTAWMTSDAGGPMLMEGEERDAFVREAVFNGERVEWKTAYKTVECTGVGAVNEKPCYKVLATSAAGDTQTLFFDKETGFLSKIESVNKTPMGEMTVEEMYEDYRKVDDITYPHKVSAKYPMGMQVRTVESIKHNVDLPADRFDPPADVKALIEKAKEGAKEGAKDAAKGAAEDVKDKKPETPKAPAEPKEPTKPAEPKAPEKK